MGIDLSSDIGFSVSDLFATAMSLAANYWMFLLLALAFVFAKDIYKLCVIALIAARNYDRDRIRLKSGEKMYDGGRLVDSSNYSPRFKDYWEGAEDQYWVKVNRGRR